MWSWEKLGRVFNPIDIADRPSWMDQYAQAPCTLLYDGFVRVYFSCRPRAEPDGQFVSHPAYVDLDRTDLFNVLRVASKPILDLGGRGCFDEFGIYPFSVIRDGGRILAYYAGHTRCASVPFNTAIGLAESMDDGETFYRVGSGPVLPASLHEPFVLSGPKIRRFEGRYWLFYIAGRRWIESGGRMEVIYRIRMAHSEDGRSWQKGNVDLIPAQLGDREVQSSPDILFRNGRYHMFFSYMQTPDFRWNREKAYRIGYASSSDLVHWDRDDAKAGLDVSKEGFDEEMVAYPHVFELDGQLLMLYLGNGVGREGFGLARLCGELD